MQPKSQVCGDAPLLLWYAAGALEEKEASIVAGHVADCANCRALVQENQELARIYLTASARESRHLSPETLFRLVSDEPGSDVGDARRHLTTCGECREIVSVLEKVQKEEEGASGAEPIGERVRAVWAGLDRFMELGWMRSPVPAYLLALLLLYPAYRGLIGAGAQPTPHLLPTPVPIASETERGPAETPIRVEAGTEQTVLTVFVPIARDRYRYRLELRTREGRRLFVVDDAQSFDGLGTFALTLPKGYLGAGVYELRVGEWERDGREPANEYVFPFSVE